MQKIFRIPMEKMFAVMPKMRALMADADFKVINFEEKKQQQSMKSNFCDQPGDLWEWDLLDRS